MRSIVLVLALAPVLLLSGEAAAVNNPYGVHCFIQDAMSDSLINVHLNWAASLTGPGGYVKQLMYPASAQTTTINPQWPKFIDACYDRELIPVIRLGTHMVDGVWQKPAADSPGNYATWANAIKNIVSQMPRRDGCLLYIEVLNECNLNIEWSGQANPTEYAQFFVQTSAAIRSLGDSRIKVMNCGLSPGGSYNNVQYVEACCQVPGFIDAFDVWACHPYPFYPPEANIHDGTATMGMFTIDSYLAELQVLANHGRADVKIIATETGYSLAEDGEDARADRTMRAFRDGWSKWPEVLGVCPYQFCNPIGEDDGQNWVYPTSGTTPEGLPTQAHGQYWAVHRLAKPWQDIGCISGKVTESAFGAPLSGASVVLNPGGNTATTDSAGNFYFPRLSAGVYSVSVSKPNYSSGEANGIDVAAAENEVRNFSLAPTAGCNIVGTVRDSVGGQVIPGVQISLSPGGHSATTDPDGAFALLGIVPSTYTLSASKASYYSFTSAGISLQAGESETHDFWLGPGSPPAGTCLIGGVDLDSPIGPGTATGWVAEGGTGNNFYVDSSNRYSGRASQRINPFGAGNDMLWTITNYSSVTSGKRYRIEAWCKAGSALAGAAKLVGNWYSNDMAYGGTFYGVPQLTTATGWTLLVARGICPSFPATGNRGRLQVELRAETTAGSVWFDQVWCGEDNQAEEPVASIGNLSQGTGALRAYFSWVNSSSANCTGTKIVYRTDRYPLTVNDGTLVADVSGNPGALLTSHHMGLELGARYYYGFFAHGAGGANVSRPKFATAVGVDPTRPVTPVVTDEGDYTVSKDTLSASWTATDPDTPIINCRYAIGTTPGGRDVVDWTDIGPVTSVTRSGLPLVPGKQYYISVIVQNAAELWSLAGRSDGIYAVADCEATPAAKALPDGAMVRLSGSISSAGAFGDSAHLQDVTRAGGIRLEGSIVGLAEGQSVAVAGTLGTEHGERVLTVIWR